MRAWLMNPRNNDLMIGFAVGFWAACAVCALLDALH